MKQLILSLGLAAIAPAAFAKGTVVYANTATTTFQTNAVATGGNGPGNAVAAGGPYYYELLIASSTVTTVDASLQQLLTSTWSDTTLEATNTGFAGRLAGLGGNKCPGSASLLARAYKSVLVVWW